MIREKWTYENQAPLLRSLEGNRPLSVLFGMLADSITQDKIATKSYLLMADYVDIQQGKEPVSLMEERLENLIGDLSSYDPFFEKFYKRVMEQGKDPSSAFSQIKKKYRNAELNVEVC